MLRGDADVRILRGWWHAAGMSPHDDRDRVTLPHRRVLDIGHTGGSANTYPLNKYMHCRESDGTDATLSGKIRALKMPRTKRKETCSPPPRPPTPQGGKRKKVPFPKPCQRFGKIKNKLAFFPGLIKSREDAPATASRAPHKAGHAPAGSPVTRVIAASTTRGSQGALFPSQFARGGERWPGRQQGPCQHFGCESPQERHCQEQLLIYFQCPLSFSFNWVKRNK